ncbi:hypothetical protein BC831DRAFT_465727 [Entophlyctis helioformis]|nr:hypothetical protein BC831DRAFT_465727 [Entophlyctis helioformis]
MDGQALRQAAQTVLDIELLLATADRLLATRQSIHAAHGLQQHQHQQHHQQQQQQEGDGNADDSDEDETLLRDAVQLVDKITAFESTVWVSLSKQLENNPVDDSLVAQRNALMQEYASEQESLVQMLERCRQMDLVLGALLAA